MTTVRLRFFVQAPPITLCRHLIIGQIDSALEIQLSLFHVIPYSYGHNINEKHKPGLKEVEGKIIYLT